MGLSNHTELKKDSYSKGSKKKLIKGVVHKIKRTFVACLDVVEKELGSDSEEFQRIRRRILGIGNDQIRNVEMELQERYNVEYLNYTIQMEVKPLEEYTPDFLLTNRKGY